MPFCIDGDYKTLVLLFEILNLVDEKKVAYTSILQQILYWTKQSDLIDDVVQNQTSKSFQIAEKSQHILFGEVSERIFDIIEKGTNAEHTKIAYLILINGMSKFCKSVDIQQRLLNLILKVPQDQTKELPKTSYLEDTLNLEIHPLQVFIARHIRNPPTFFYESMLKQSAILQFTISFDFILKEQVKQSFQASIDESSKIPFSEKETILVELGFFPSDLHMTNSPESEKLPDLKDLQH